MTTEFKYDVFISYSSKDKEWVRGELLKRIEETGLKAFIDYRDFIRGAPSIKEMERGVKECRKSLLVLTPNYLESGWSEIENIMLQTLDPANRELRLIPLLKDPCEKPLRISALTHIDFTDGADHDLAWRQLFTSLGKPIEPQPVKEPQRDGWHLAHPYPMPPDFTGRKAERAMLTRWLNADATHPMLILRALGGFGKSALAWHWLLYDVAPIEWPRVVWWSFYESDAGFDNFLNRTLSYLGGKKSGSQSWSTHEQVEKLLEILHEKGILIVLDGFERILRAYCGLNAAYQADNVPASGDNDCDSISPHADRFLRNLATLPDIRAKILLTSRLRPKAVEQHGALLNGCRESELLQMQDDDAVAFFQAQGIRGTHTEIKAACEPYGFHPLSLRLLAGLILNDVQQSGDIASAKKIDVSGNLIQRKHHVLEVSYNSLAPEQQKLLSRIACFRSPVPYKALMVLIENKTRSLDTDLKDLISRGLLHHETKERKFDLHPIVRRYAYIRLTEPDRVATHIRLRDYFADVPKPNKITHLKGLAPVVEFYHHTAKAGQYEEAYRFFEDRINSITHFQLGAYQLRIDLLRALFPDGEDHLPRLKNEISQGNALNNLAISYSLSGQPRRAVPLLEAACKITKKRENKYNFAIALGNLGNEELEIGAILTAESNQRQKIDLSEEINSDFVMAVGHGELGLLLAYRGAYTESDFEIAASIDLCKKIQNFQGQGIGWAYRTLRELLIVRSAQWSIPHRPELALNFARNALDLADKDAYTTEPCEQDYIRAHWILGAAHRVAGNYGDAENNLNAALERCRRINCMDFEAPILIDLARLRGSTNLPDEAKQLAEEAFYLTERSGYVLQGADAHLELAKLAQARGDMSIAKDHAQKAKDLATCDGPPDYTYKAAYDEACAMLEKVGS